MSSRFWALNMVVALLSMEDQKALRFHQKYLKLCFKDEQSSYRFGTTWGWIINDIIFIFGWANPLILILKLCSCDMTSLLLDLCLFILKITFGWFNLKYLFQLVIQVWNWTRNDLRGNKWGEYNARNVWFHVFLTMIFYRLMFCYIVILKNVCCCLSFWGDHWNALLFSPLPFS